MNASDLERRLNVVDGCIYHFQILGVVPLGFAAFDVAIVSLGALYLLIQRLLEVLYLVKIVGERGTLARLNERPLQTLDLLLLFQLLNLLRQINLVIQKVHFGDAVAVRNRHVITVDRQLARKVAVLLASYLRRLVCLLLVP